MQPSAMRMRFIDTKVEEKEDRVTLTTQSGHVLLEMTRLQYESAVRTGVIDPENLHYSLYEYARMIREGSNVAAAASQKLPSSDSDRDFLASCNISWW